MAKQKLEELIDTKVNPLMALMKESEKRLDDIELAVAEIHKATSEFIGRG